MAGRAGSYEQARNSRALGIPLAVFTWFLDDYGEIPEMPLKARPPAQANAARKAAARQRRAQLWQAPLLQRKEDKRLPPYMIGAFC